MTIQSSSVHGLKLYFAESAEETHVHCSGRITSSAAANFQSEILNRAIPASRGKGAAVTCRIVLDLSKVSFIDSRGLAALLAVWTSAQKASCALEIVNFGPNAANPPGMPAENRLLQAFKSLLSLVRPTDTHLERGSDTH